MGRRFASLALGALVLAGCTVGPDYNRPAPLAGAALPGRFAAMSPSFSSTEPVDQWWRLYHAPALDRLVPAALAANTDLRVALANLSEARAALAGARSRHLPSTSLSAGAGYGVSSSALVASEARGRSPNPDAILQASVDVSWEIDLFGRIRRGVEAARADVGASEAARDGARAAVVAETVRAYVDACAYGEAAIVQRRSLSVAARTSDVTRQQLRAGEASVYEAARAQSLEANARAGIPQLEAERQAALYRLAVLTGQPPETDLAEAKACVRSPELAIPLPVGDGRLLLARRPDVRQAERQLAADTARIGVATAELYPTIRLGGSLAALSPTIAGLSAATNRTWSVGPLLTWTFPNVSAARARIHQSEARAEASLARFDGTVLNALSEAEQALVREAAELDRRRSLQVGRARDAEAVAVAEQRFKVDAIGFLELLDAQRTLIADDAALSVANRLVGEDQIVVFKALGGGWISGPSGEQDVRPF